MTNSNQKQSNPPIDTVRIGRVSSSIWERTDAKGNRFYSVTFSRSYRDENGKIQYADSYGHHDLLRLEKVAGETFRRVDQLEQQDREAQYASTETDTEAAT